MRLQTLSFVATLSMAVVFAGCKLTPPPVAATADAAPMIRMPDEQALNTNAANKIFDEVRATCEADAGKLWGRSLCAPVLIVNVEDDRMVASRAGSGLTAQDGVFVGPRPQGVPAGDSVVEWDGARWLVLALPLPDTDLERRDLIGRQMWSLVSGQLEIPPSGPEPAHLLTHSGAELLRLEWRALEEALTGPPGPQDANRLTAVNDALTFRAARLALAGPSGARAVRLSEDSRGLGAYTGIVLAGYDDPEAEAVGLIRRAYRSERLGWDFAVSSGAAYGLLLDRYGPGWRMDIGGAPDLGALLAQAPEIGFERPADMEAAVRDARARYSENRAD